MNDQKKMPTDPLTIYLGVGGGVAAYKAAALASALTRAAAEVHVALTPAAARFVTPLTFTALTGHPARDTMFPNIASNDPQTIYPHLFPADRADAAILAPATADLIARVAAGMADDLPAAACLALPETCARFVCPAMNAEMWRQPVVQRNLQTLRDLGWTQLGPDDGRQACGTIGEGRMAEPQQIADTVLEGLSKRRKIEKIDIKSEALSLEGESMLILSGPTVEPLDPVRYLSNHSSGKMGRALALTAAGAGAYVHFITGPIPAENLPTQPRITIEYVTTAASMLAAARSKFNDSTIAIFAAAVADFAPQNVSQLKLPKPDKAMTLTLLPTPDIAAELCVTKGPDQTCVGFALQMDDGPAKARDKLNRKNLDAIILNTPSSLARDTGQFTLITRGQPDQSWGDISKEEAALRILRHVQSVSP